MCVDKGVALVGKETAQEEKKWKGAKLRGRRSAGVRVCFFGSSAEFVGRNGLPPRIQQDARRVRGASSGDSGELI